MKRLFVLSIVLLVAAPSLAQDWGEARYAHSTVNIRSERSKTSAVVGRLASGDEVRVDFCEEDEASEVWCAVFPTWLTVRDETRALGYVYEPLLRFSPPLASPSSRSEVRTCCKICSKGKACGDSCIARNKTCHKGPGCACNG